MTQTRKAFCVAMLGTAWQLLESAQPLSQPASGEACVSESGFLAAASATPGTSGSDSDIRNRAGKGRSPSLSLSLRLRQLLRSCVCYCLNLWLRQLLRSCVCYCLNLWLRQLLCSCVRYCRLQLSRWSLKQIQRQIVARIVCTLWDRNNDGARFLLGLLRWRRCFLKIGVDRKPKKKK